MTPMQADSTNGTLLLGARDVAELLDYPSCIAAVEDAFRRQGRGELPPAAICGVRVPDGGFHIKAAALPEPVSCFAAKANANFPDNGARYGLPTVQGVVLLFDASRGRPLAVMDSAELTLRRTASATAVAARHLARPDARTLVLYGCGAQGRAHLEAMVHVLRLERVFALDRDRGVAERLASRMSRRLDLEVHVVDAIAEPIRGADVYVTCTTSRRPLLTAADVPAGAFVAGVGADNGDKHELAPDLLARSTLVVDSLEQCAAIGDLHHALAAGVMEREAVHAELGEVVTGARRGRTGAEEITVFDSIGTAIQDVAAAVVVYERALAARRGARFDFAQPSTGRLLPA
jgi:ornithine cyclodeaminase/alanine dehydrogenase-like protein (mu-crystallin family)